MIVVKNATLDKPWFFVSHPHNIFCRQNSSIPLWHIVRASSAAPTYFPPHSFKNGEGSKYEFVDGGMSMFNNPSFRLFLEVTRPDYNISWQIGKEHLLMVSVGTGFSERHINLGKAKKYTLISWASYAVETLMDDANVQQNFLMKIIGRTPRPEQINSELSAQSVPTAINNFLPPQLLTYHRYTTSFSQERFKQLGVGHIDPKSVNVMDCIERILELREIGQAVAQEQVSIDDFEGFLKPN